MFLKETQWYKKRSELKRKKKLLPIPESRDNHCSLSGDLIFRHLFIHKEKHTHTIWCKWDMVLYYSCYIVVVFYAVNGENISLSVKRAWHHYFEWRYAGTEFHCLNELEKIYMYLKLAQLFKRWNYHFGDSVDHMITRENLCPIGPL